MGSAKPSGYYDEIYSSASAYEHGKPWRHLWSWALQHVSPDDRVVELGCGNGHLAAMLLEHGVASYTGFDFSPVALRQAVRRVPEYSFVESCLPVAIGECDVVVAVEVLEHIGDDMGTIEAIPAGVKLVATVPTFDDPGHARIFETAVSVVERYGGLLESVNVVRLGQHYGFVATRRK